MFWPLPPLFARCPVCGLFYVSGVVFSKLHVEKKECDTESTNPARYECKSKAWVQCIHCSSDILGMWQHSGTDHSTCSFSCHDHILSDMAILEFFVVNLVLSDLSILCGL